MVIISPRSPTAISVIRGDQTSFLCSTFSDVQPSVSPQTVAQSRAASRRPYSRHGHTTMKTKLGAVSMDGSPQGRWLRAEQTNRKRKGEDQQGSRETSRTR